MEPACCFRQSSCSRSRRTRASLPRDWAARAKSRSRARGPRLLYRDRRSSPFAVMGVDVSVHAEAEPLPCCEATHGTASRVLVVEPQPVLNPLRPQGLSRNLEAPGGNELLPAGSSRNASDRQRAGRVRPAHAGDRRPLDAFRAPGGARIPPTHPRRPWETRARRFNVPTEVWEKVSPVDQWAANQKFLDRMIARGDDVILASPVKAAEPATFFARELEYLRSRGFTLSSDGTRMLPPSR
jgi:hypothetical protein